jgi:hypothetical protein
MQVHLARNLAGGVPGYPPPFSDERSNKKPALLPGTALRLEVESRGNAERTMSLSPIEWLAWIYGKCFQNHPLIGGALVTAIFAAVGLVLWIRAIDRYKEDHPLPKTQAVTSSKPGAPVTAEHPMPASDTPNRSSSTKNRSRSEGVGIRMVGDVRNNRFGQVVVSGVGKAIEMKAGPDGKAPSGNTFGRVDVNPPAPVINNAPNGIANSGTIIGSPTVTNNYGVTVPPRHLTDPNAVIAGLRKGAGNKYRVVATGGEESVDFAGEIRSVFEAAGWVADGNLNATFGATNEPIAENLALIAEKETPLVVVVREAFSKANLNLPLDPYGYVGPASLGPAPEVTVEVLPQQPR